MIHLSRAEIEPLIDFEQAATLIEAAYIASSKGHVNLPPVGHITFPDHSGDCHIKYGHMKNDDVFVIKVATGFEGNAALGLPNGNGISLLLSAQTGEVKAVLHDEMYMTDIRTAIGGAVATRALCRHDSRVVGIVGTGMQAREQIKAHSLLMPNFKLQFKIWGRSMNAALRIVDDLSKHSIDVNVESSLADMCAQSDIIVTTTSARTPIIQNDWVQRGTHITAVGADAPGKQELCTDLVVRADCLVADLKTQCIDHGELAVPAAAGHISGEQVVELGNVLDDANLGRTAAGDITIVDLTGIAAQDIAIAKTILETFEQKA